MSMADLFPDTNTSTPEQRDKWAQQVREAINKDSSSALDPKEVFRYLCILHENGEPRVGPDTALESLRKWMYAEAYVRSYEELLYGKRGRHG